MRLLNSMTVVLLVAVYGACACHSDGIGLPVVAPGPTPGFGGGLAIPSPNFGDLPSENQASIAALAALAHETVSDPQFKLALEHIDKLELSVDGGTRPGPEVFKIYAGLDAAFKPVSTSYKLIPFKWYQRESETAHTGVNKTAATTVLRPVVLQRFETGEVEPMACAVNTLAHEWAHAIPNTAGGSLFQDRRHSGSRMPLVSYTVGAVAQCVYLKQHGYPGLDVSTCVDRVGTVAFNADTCRRGWGQSVTPLPASRAQPVDIPGPADITTIDALCAELLTEAQSGHEAPGVPTMLGDYCRTGGGDPHMTQLAARRLLTQMLGQQAPAARTKPLRDALTREGARSTGLTTTGGSLEADAISALVSVVASRATAELQSYAIDRIHDLACDPQRKRWLADTCAFVSTGDDELPVTFGAGLRGALVKDALALPRRAIAALPPRIGGTHEALDAVLFVETATILVQKADIYEVGHQMTELAGSGSDAFHCDPKDTVCARTLNAIGFSGEVITDAMAPSLPDVATLEASLTAAMTHAGISGPLDPADVQALLEQLTAARNAGIAIVNAPTRTDKLAKVRQLVEAVVASADLLFHIAHVDARIPDGLPDLVDGLARGDVQAVAIAAISVIQKLPLAADLDPKALRIISFAGEIASAKTSADAKAAIEAVIAPIGTYKLKRDELMLSLGGLVGIGYGGETLQSNSVLASGETARSGLVAPVGYLGLDLNAPLHNRFVPHAGVFLSLIDFGSLLSYRTSSDSITVRDPANPSMTTTGTVSNSSTFGFVQLLSPGAYVRIGIGETPLILAFGAAWVPDARHVDFAGTSSDLSALRWSVSLSIDVTLLPFHL